MNKKYVFLDIDGVMNHKEHHPISDKHIMQSFCPVATENLRWILESCNAKIVVSSTWRKMFKTTRRLKKELFCHYGLEKRVVGLTPVITDALRGDEIRWYMSQHGIAEEDMIILDDDADMGILLHRLVQTSWFEGGLTKEKAEKAVELLKGSVNP